MFGMLKKSNFCVTFFAAAAAAAAAAAFLPPLQLQGLNKSHSEQ